MTMKIFSATCFSDSIWKCVSTYQVRICTYSCVCDKWKYVE